LLRMIAGLETITEGTISIGGTVVNRLPPKERDVSMVFQNYAPYPHLTVAQNMGFSLMLAHAPQSERVRRVKEVAEILGLSDLLDRKPKQLSGGQRQRVAMGRAIVRDPRVFLFDEPLSNLDAKLRVAMRAEIKSLHRKIGNTAIYVTHDQVEAMTMADRLVVLEGGRIEQIGTPMELYLKPDNMFVAGFIGSPSMNFLKTRIGEESGGKVVCNPAGPDIPLPEGWAVAEAGTEVTLGIRPENLSAGGSDDTILEGTVDVIEVLGELTILYLDAGLPEPIVVKAPGDSRFSIGSRVAVACSPAHMHLFDAEGVTLTNGLQ